jgi:diacylglycerol kinase family enzyme
MGPGRSIAVIFNRSSGSAEAKGAKLDEALARAALPATVVRVGGSEVAAAAERAASAGHVLVAAGGDGTVSTVASVAVNAGSVFGVIPLGTLNHFARDAGIPTDLDEAIATVAAGHSRQLDVGDVNGVTFINNTSLGLYPRLVWEREQERCRGRGKWTAFAIALARTWRRYPTVHVRMIVDGLPLIRRTPFVFVGNGVYRAEGLGVGTRDSLGGTLSIYSAPDVERFEFPMLPIRALAGRLGADVNFEAFKACEITIDTRRQAVDLAVDGELRSVRAPLRYTVRSRALTALVPEAA